MKVGDPKKALVLAIVAMIVLGVAAFQLVPKATKIANVLREQSQGQAAPEAPKPEVSKPLPTVLVSAPFNKPKTVDQIKAEAKQAPPPPAAGRKPNELGVAPLQPNVMTGTLPAAGATPSEIAGINQQIKQEHKKTLTLLGILRVKHPVAFIEVAGLKDAPEELELGVTIGDYKLIQLGKTSITLAKPGKKPRQIYIGKTVDL